MELLEPWPTSEDELVALQHRLASEASQARTLDPWRLHTVDEPGVPQPSVGGCFLAYAPGEAGPGRAGDNAWAAAVVWRAGPATGPRPVDDALRGVRSGAVPRQSLDTLEQRVVAGQVGARYVPGLLAMREGRLLAGAVASLRFVPDVLMVDATGLDHPRRAGLAIHLGAVVGLPTVGVTHRPLVAVPAAAPGAERGSTAPVLHDGDVVGHLVRTRTGALPVVAHAGWRTDPDTAAAVVLLSSSEAARTPIPLQDARRVAREARALRLS